MKCRRRCWCRRPYSPVSVLLFGMTTIMCFLYRLPQTNSFLIVARRRFFVNRNDEAKVLSYYWQARRLFASSINSDNNNPTLQWKGASHSNSSFATHVLIEEKDAAADAVLKSNTVESVVQRVVSRLAVEKGLLVAQQQQQQQQQQEQQRPATMMTASELLEFGSVWFLEASAPRDPSQGAKPVRLGLQHAAQVLQPGDYLRIHHTPRRYRAVYEYDWSKKCADNDDNNGNKPGVIVESDRTKGWLVIDKPAQVPVHMTVDNCQENVATCLQKAIMEQQQQNNSREGNNSNYGDIYVSTPQRLDQNTSGLLVVSTTYQFAKYYAQLLRYKTERQLEHAISIGNTSNGSSCSSTLEETATATATPTTESLGGVHKLYRCLVCLLCNDDDDNNNNRPIAQTAAELQSYAKTGQILRHYLEPSIYAPKRFVKEPPPPLSEGASAVWPECLLRIRKASPIYALVGNAAGQNLKQALWNSSCNSRTVNAAPDDYHNGRVPDNCHAVMELEIELLTGRTHQIRGQLAASNVPVVGDVLYGGARPMTDEEIDKYNNRSEYYLNSDRLALQCCEVEFLDPDVNVNDDNGTVTLTRSDRWNKFRLDTAWWTPLLKQYEDEMQNHVARDQATISLNVDDDDNNDPPEQTATSSSLKAVARPDLLPPRVSLSPGKNKYVLIRATHPADDNEMNVQWFVKSATPGECGGPYHGNVAQDLREWIEAAGYVVEVTGGGRIDYNPGTKTAVVYGFSYGFGKGDHAKAAELIKESFGGGDIDVSYDNSEGLY